MKNRSSLILVLWLISLAVSGAATAPGAAPTPKPAPKASVPATKPAPKVSAPAVKPVEEMGKIEGFEITRKTGGYLGLQIVGGNFKLSFYNEKKKPVAVDVPRGTARWDNKQKVGNDFNVLNPGSDGQSLVGNKFVRPPHNFLVFISLLNPAGEAVESYTVNMMK